MGPTQRSAAFKDREKRCEEVQVSHCSDPLCLYEPSLGSVGVPPVLRAPSALPRHQLLRISAADEAQVQKVKELESLEHLQVREAVRGSLGTHRSTSGPHHFPCLSNLPVKSHETGLLRKDFRALENLMAFQDPFPTSSVCLVPSKPLHSDHFLTTLDFVQFPSFPILFLLLMPMRHPQLCGAPSVNIPSPVLPL